MALPERSAIPADPPRRRDRETGCGNSRQTEFSLNGSVKDRAALYIIQDASARGALKPGGTVVKAAAGNTGIGLAISQRTRLPLRHHHSRDPVAGKNGLAARARRRIRKVPAAPYRDPNNYVKLAGRVAETVNAIWANQFDNVVNRQRITRPPVPRSGATPAGASTRSAPPAPAARSPACALPEGKSCRADCARRSAGQRPSITGSKRRTEARGQLDYRSIGSSRITANLEDTPIDDARSTTGMR
jgi:cysteine synthase A